MAAGDRAATVTTALVQFREVYTYFGKIGLRFDDTAPDPMAVLLLDRLRRRRIPNILLSALTHRDLERIKGFEVWDSVDTMRFVADPPVAVQADGEGLGLADGGTVDWAADSLLVVAGALLMYEHSLVDPDDLARLDAAFFMMNGMISIAFFFFVLLDRLSRAGLGGVRLLG